MHIPDGFLNIPVMVGTYTVSLTSLGILRNKIKNQFDEQSIPKISLLAAFLFVAQMINIPVTGGTSAHLLGAILALLLAGPYVAVFVMVLVLTIQMLIFQDGGLSAWGANVLNLALIPIFTGYFGLKIFKPWFKHQKRLPLLEPMIIFLIVWISVQTSAVSCSVELALSQLAPFANILSLMVAINALTGLVEGIVTVMIYEVVKSNRPDIIRMLPSSSYNQ
jgi:cobalt/nickel transport system permease protein